MSKYTEKRIAEIESLTTVEIPAAIDKGINTFEYFTHRVTLNYTIIQAILGVELPKAEDVAKHKGRIKFNHKIANHEEINKIVYLINNFIANVENPFLNTNKDEVAIEEEDDMNIPDRVSVIDCIPQLDKVNHKHVYSYIFGNEGCNGIGASLLTGIDVVNLAATAEKIKKTKTRNTMLLVGGIALIITGGTIAAVCIAKNNKNKNDSVAEIEVVEVDLDDMPDVDIEDMPEVNLDDMPEVKLD